MARLISGISLPLVVVLMVPLFFVTAGNGCAAQGGSSLHFGAEKVTILHFFFHDTITGKNPTAVKVAEPVVTAMPFQFGTVYVIDDPLTEGINRASRVIGNAQGIYALSGLNDFSLMMVVDFVFTAGEYNGSSITVASRNPIMNTSREVAVVGGTGRFRLARGFAQLTTRYLKAPDAIVEYNVTVLHY